MAVKKEQNFYFYVVIGISLLVIVTMGWLILRKSFFLRYTNPGKGFTIKYPKNWDVEEGVQGTTVMFLSPKRTDLDIFRENVNIVVAEIPSSIRSLKDYSQKAIEQMVAVFDKNMQIIDSYETRFGGQPAYRFSYYGKGKPMDIQMLHVWTLKDGFAYQFTFTSAPETYEDYLDEIERMIKSFRFIKRGAPQKSKDK